MALIDVRETLRAPIEGVFEILTDHGNYDSFEGIRRSVLTREGRAERNGVGAQRKIWAGPMVLWEDIVGFERPTLLEYRIVKLRPPIARHVMGRVRLSKRDDGGTDVVWTSEFHSTVPLIGRLLEPRTRDTFDAAFRAMLRETERRVLAGER